MGSLDSGRHTAVVFHETSNPNKSTTHPNSSKRLIPVSTSGSGKGFDTRRKGISKKCNKALHGNNTRFTFTGSQRVSLKESMKQIAEILSAFSNTNLDSVLPNELDEQNEGSFLLGQT